MSSSLNDHHTDTNLYFLLHVLANRCVNLKDLNRFDLFVDARLFCSIPVFGRNLSRGLSSDAAINMIRDDELPHP